MNKLGRLLITGLARNVADVLPREINRLESTSKEFYEEVDFHVIESDSIDETRIVLREISKANPNFSFEALGDLQREFSDRIARLRFCRNKYVDFYRKSKNSYTHVMVVDFDIRNNRFDQDSLSRALNCQQNWDALFANQTGRYFDIFALRSEFWCLKDCMKEVDELVKQGHTRESAREIAIWKKMKRIPATSDLIEVDSAFGGMAIYKNWIFDNYDYSFASTPIGAKESEHVPLHFKARKAGAVLFIHPGFNNFAWNPHNLASFKILRKIDQLSNNPSMARFRRKIRPLLG